MAKDYTVEDVLRLPGEGEKVGDMVIKVHAGDLGKTFSVMEDELQPKQMIAATTLPVRIRERSKKRKKPTAPSATKRGPSSSCESTA